MQCSGIIIIIYRLLNNQPFQFGLSALHIIGQCFHSECHIKSGLLTCSDGGMSDGGMSDGGMSDGGMSDGGMSDGGMSFLHCNYYNTA